MLVSVSILFVLSVDGLPLVGYAVTLVYHGVAVLVWIGLGRVDAIVVVAVVLVKVLLRILSFVDDSPQAL